MTGAPLEGVKVLDLSTMYPGAFCSLLLADLGADVVKVERPKAGDGMRMLAAPGSFNAAHTAFNRGKRSVVVDTRNERAGEVLRPLMAWADLVIESNRPGQLDGMGLGFEAMRAENPALVWCSVTGFGTTGPNALAGGHDVTFLGAAGVLAKLAESDPTPPATVVSLPLAGSMAAVGLLAALLQAGRTGEGRFLEVSMTEAATWILSEDIAREANEPGAGWGAFASRNTYRCADGRYVSVAATEPKPWAAFVAALGDESLAPLQYAAGDAVDRIAAIVATRDAAHWCETPGLDGGVGPVLDSAEVVADPATAARENLVTIEGSDTRAFASPIRWNGPTGVASSLARSAPPDLGADTDAVLAAAGLSADTISELRSGGAIA